MRKLESVCNGLRETEQCTDLPFSFILDDLQQTLSEVLEVLSHVLLLSEIGVEVISTIIKSINNILSINLEESEYAGVASSLTMLINALFSVQCIDKHRSEKEVLISRIVFLFNTVITKRIWLYINEEAAWSIFYFYFYVYHSVHSFS